MIRITGDEKELLGSFMADDRWQDISSIDERISGEFVFIRNGQHPWVKDVEIEKINLALEVISERLSRVEKKRGITFC